MGWAIGWWGLLEGKALRDNILKINGPTSLLDFPPRLFLAYVESLLREDEELAEELDKIYAKDSPAKAVSRDETRRQELMSVLAHFG